MLELKNSERIDWFRVTVDLADHGVTISRLSTSIDIPISTIKGWRLQAGRPRFEEALKVISYWAEVTGRPIENVPIYDPFKHESQSVGNPSRPTT